MLAATFAPSLHSNIFAFPAHNAAAALDPHVTAVVPAAAAHDALPLFADAHGDLFPLMTCADGRTRDHPALSDPALFRALLESQQGREAPRLDYPLEQVPLHAPLGPFRVDVVLGRDANGARYVYLATATGHASDATPQTVPDLLRRDPQDQIRARTAPGEQCVLKCFSISRDDGPGLGHCVAQRDDGRVVVANGFLECVAWARINPAALLGYFYVSAPTSHGRAATSLADRFSPRVRPKFLAAVAPLTLMLERVPLEAGLVWRGLWQSELAYHRGDVALCNGHLYVCAKPSPPARPPGEPGAPGDDWVRMTRRRPVATFLVLALKKLDVGLFNVLRHDEPALRLFIGTQHYDDELVAPTTAKEMDVFALHMCAFVLFVLLPVCKTQHRLCHNDLKLDNVMLSPSPRLARFWRVKHATTGETLHLHTYGFEPALIDYGMSSMAATGYEHGSARVPSQASGRVLESDIIEAYNDQFDTDMRGGCASTDVAQLCTHLLHMVADKCYQPGFYHAALVDLQHRLGVRYGHLDVGRFADLYTRASREPAYDPWRVFCDVFEQHGLQTPAPLAGCYTYNPRVYT